MQQQETASLSDQAMDDLYVAQYLAMTGMSDTAGRDVTRINVACPAIPPDNMFVSVDWDRRETSITYTYGYREGQTQYPLPATSASAPVVQNPVASSTNAGPAGAAAVEVPGSASTTATPDAEHSTTAGNPTPNVAPGSPSGTTESNERPSDSGPQQASQQDEGSQESGAGSVRTAPGPPPVGTSAAPGRQATVGQTNGSAGEPEPTATVKIEKLKTEHKRRISVVRHQNKIPRTEHYTVYYSSCARDPLSEPHPVRRAPGVLYVHRHKHETEAKWDTQMWMYVRPEPAQGAVRKGLFLLQNHDASAGGEWIRVRPGQEHPKLPGYVLHVRAAGKPSWVKASTARTYRARAQADS